MGSSLMNHISLVCTQKLLHFLKLDKKPANKALLSLTDHLPFAQVGRKHHLCPTLFVCFIGRWSWRTARSNRFEQWSWIKVHVATDRENGYSILCCGYSQDFFVSFLDHKITRYYILWLWVAKVAPVLLFIWFTDPVRTTEKISRCFIYPKPYSWKYPRQWNSLDDRFQ